MAGAFWRSLGANHAQEDALEQAWDLPAGKILPCGKGRVFRHRNALCYIGKVTEGERLLRSFKDAGAVRDQHPHVRASVHEGGMDQNLVLKALEELGHVFSMTDKDGILLDLGSRLPEGWQVRPWMAGDQCVIPNGHRKLVSDILQTHRVQRPFKDTWPVICHGQDVVGCPLPLMPNQWVMGGDSVMMRWEWKSRVRYTTHH